MDCFIKKIFLNKVDEKAHNQFVRFGKGDYKGRAVLNLKKNSKIKFNGSFEYANDFVLLACETAGKFSGIILSREKLDFEGKIKNGLYAYEVKEIGSEEVKKIFNKGYYFLLDASDNNFQLKIKKKLPKPGKAGETKIDGKFCQLEAGLNFWHKIKEAFFWDAEGKKIKVKHEYIINELAFPEGEKDFEKIRIMTRRKGRIIRKLEIDGREEITEKEFEA